MSNKLSLQPRHPASEVTDWSFMLKFASWAGHQHSAQLATYVPSLCGSQECEEVILAPCACGSVTVSLVVCRLVLHQKRAFILLCLQHKKKEMPPNFWKLSWRMCYSAEVTDSICCAKAEIVLYSVSYWTVQSNGWWDRLGIFPTKMS